MIKTSILLNKYNNMAKMTDLEFYINAILAIFLSKMRENVIQVNKASVIQEIPLINKIVSYRKTHTSVPRSAITEPVMLLHISYFSRIPNTRQTSHLVVDSIIVKQ